MKYDYIIAGAGCGGLSLLYRILKNSTLQGKRILLIDKEQKTTNDRTWCFWEEASGLFESIVHHEWKTLQFKTENFTNEFTLKDYSYKMIKGLDFYNLVLEYAKDFTNVEVKHEEILSFDVKDTTAEVITTKGNYSAEYIFNSTNLLHPSLSKKDTLLQHFMGWEIETKAPIFNPEVGRLMDFSVGQENGLTFMYVLPVSKHRALIEYTLFTPEVLEKQVYKAAIKEYISNEFTTAPYSIIQDEYGVIPMSLQKFSTHNKNRIINIGTAGGYTKSSTGYTFQFVQKHTEKIVIQLEKNKSPLVRLTFKEKVFQWYDRTLLEVLLSKKMEGKRIFSTMFRKIAPERILRFLGNESTLLDDVTIMKSLPTGKFLIAGIKQMFK